MRESRIIGIAIILTILIAGGYLTYQYQFLELTAPKTLPPKTVQKTSPSRVFDTSNWKTYRNEKYEFEVRYPGQSVLSAESDEIGLFVLVIGEVILQITEKTHPRLSHFLTNPECYDNIADETHNDINWTISRWRCGIGSERNPIASSAVNEQQGLVYELHLDAESERAAKEIMNQIISTFKFIK